MPALRLKNAVRTDIGRRLSTSPYFWRVLSGRALILMYHRVLPAHDAHRGFVQPGNAHRLPESE